MAMINGTEKGNNASKGSTEAMDKLFQSVANSIGSKGRYDGFKKESPKASDVAGASSITQVIPAGFLLLHSDLQELIKSKKGGGGGGFSMGLDLVSIVGGAFAVVGAAVIAGSIIKGLFKGTSEDTDNHLNDIITELNNELTASDLANNPQVKEAQLEAFIGYLKAYYMQQSASMLVSGVLEGVGAGAGKAINSFFSNAFGKAEDSASPLQVKLNEIIDEIAVNIDNTRYLPGGAAWGTIEKETDIAVAAYLATYFATQTASMAVDNVASGVGEAIGGAIKGIFTGLFGKKEKDPLEQTLDNIILHITETIPIENYGYENAIVHKEVDIAVATYLATYFATQTASMSIESVASSAGEALGGAITGLFNGLFGKKEEDPLEQTLNKILVNIAETIPIENYGYENSVIHKEVDIAVAAYVATYFATQTASLGVETVASGAGEAIGGAINGLFKGLFGKKDENKDPLEQTLDKILANIAETIPIENYGYENSVIHKEVDIAIAAYVATYFAAQTASMTVETVSSGAGEALGGAIKGFFTGLFKKKGETTEKDPLQSKLLEIINNIATSIKVEDYTLSNKVIKAETDIAIGAFITTYFATQTASLIAKETASAIGDTAGSVIRKSVGGLFKGLFSNTTESNPLQSALLAIAENVGNDLKAHATDYGLSDPIIKTEAEVALKAFLATYFAEQTAALTVSEAGGAVGTAIGGFFRSGVTDMFKNIVGKKNAFQEAVETVIENITADKILEANGEELTKYASEKIASNAKTSIGILAQNMFDAEVSNITSKYSSSLSKKDVNAIFGGISTAFANSAKNAITGGLSFEDNNGNGVQSLSDLGITFDDSIREQTTSIIEALKTLLVELQAISKNTESLESGDTYVSVGNTDNSSYKINSPIMGSGRL